MVYVMDFKALDKDHSGALEDAEIVQLLEKQLMMPPPPAVVQAFMEQVDRNSDNRISLGEYLTYICGEGWTIKADAPVTPAVEAAGGRWLYENPYGDNEPVDPKRATFAIAVTTLPDHKQGLKQWFQWRRQHGRGAEQKWGWVSCRDGCRSDADLELHTGSTYVVDAYQMPPALELCVGDVLCVRVHTDKYHGGFWKVLRMDGGEDDAVIEFVGGLGESGIAESVPLYWEPEVPGMEWDVTYKIVAKGEGIVELCVEHPDVDAENPYIEMTYSPMGMMDEMGCMRMMGEVNGRQEYACIGSLRWEDGKLAHSHGDQE